MKRYDTDVNGRLYEVSDGEVVPAEVAQALYDALRSLLECSDHANHECGVCMCGDSMDSHTMLSGHSPCDAGEYHAGACHEYARAAIALADGESE